MILPWQFFSSLLYLTDRFHVAEGVVSNNCCIQTIIVHKRSQNVVKTSATHFAAPC